MILNSPYISGSLTVTGNIISSGSITISGSIASASYASNAEKLDNLDSTSFVFTSSYNTDSASVSTRETNLESTASILTTASASFAIVSGSYSTASGSFSTRVSKIEGNYATTGSNVFLGAQTVCANITSTGTIIAQTLNVQQVTSSIVYSSGSNIFGCSLANTQQFTGSVTMTGSLTVTTSGTSPEFQVAVGGTTIGNALTDTHNVTGSLRITGSLNTVGIACFSNTICAAQIGFNSALPSTSACAGYLDYNSGGTRIFSVGTSGATKGTFTLISKGADDSSIIPLGFSNTGVACFGYTVCSPSIDVMPSGIGVSTLGGIMRVVTTGTSTGIAVGQSNSNRYTHFAANDIQVFNDDFFLTTRCAFPLSIGTCYTARLTFAATGEACFSCQVCAPNLLIPNCATIGTVGFSYPEFRLAVTPTMTVVGNGTGQVGEGLYFKRTSNLCQGGWINGNGGSLNLVGQNKHATAFGSIYISSNNGTNTCDIMVIDGPNQRVGIGTTTPFAKLEVVGGNNLPPSTGTQNYTVALRDPTSMVADVGGSILLQGFKTSNTAIGNFAYVAGKKENGTAGNEAGYLSLGTFDSSGIPAERMRITSCGNVLVNETAVSSQGERFNVTNSNLGAMFKTTGGSTNNWAANFWNNGTSGNNLFVEFGTETAYTGRGSIDYNRGAGQTRYNTTSDANLKNIIGVSDRKKSIDILSSTKITEYSWKEDATNNIQIGVIAQELYKTFKGAVSVGSDKELLGTKDYKNWGVDKTAFTFHLIAGWQEHERIIQEQQAQIEELKSKLN